MRARLAMLGLLGVLGIGLFASDARADTFGPSVVSVRYDGFPRHEVRRDWHRGDWRHGRDWSRRWHR